MSPPRIIAIDGAAGSGKSTLARALAAALALPYVNTGLMYRALTRAALDRHVDLDDGEGLAALTRALKVRLSPGTPTQLEVEGYPQEVLATPEIDAAVSRASRHPQVRSLMRDAQRDLGAHGAVMEGRDIGTVVFPEADVKLFLHADPLRREARRSQERHAAGLDVARDLRSRDAQDAVVNPLIAADDAITLDTTDATAAATLAWALAIVRACE
ncbi:MAG: (d)CMP kinase [Actinomycetota bacterium]